MAVYVDELMDVLPAKAQARRHGRRWCHMVADSRGELDAMADRIGLARRYIQRAGHRLQHYDLTPSKRAAAVRAGAEELPTREFVAAIGRHRAARVV